MRKFLSFFIVMFLAISFANAQKSVALVNDNSISSTEADSIYNALVTGGFTVAEFNVNTDTLLYSDISNYDMVLWYLANDRVDVNLWDTITDPGVVQFYPALKEYYNNADGAIWIDGIDVILPLLVQTNGNSSNDYGTLTRPITFNSGDFIHDILGIASWDYESHTDDASDGVPQFDKASGNTITTIDPIQWKWSSLWRGDGWTPVSGAVSLYEMGPSSYAGAGYTSFHKYVNNGVELYLSSVRLSVMGDGSAVVQADIDQLVADIVNDITTSSSVNEISKASFNIYPNPAVNSALINFSDIKNASDLSVYDITGRKVYSQNIKGQKQLTINTTNFASGIYNVIISDGKNIETTKLSVVK